MECGEAWTAIDDQRRALLHLLEDLSERDWRQPSLCEGWTVRQVAAHLALQDTTWPAMPRVMLDFIRHGGMNSAIHAMACRHAVLPLEAIIGQIRDRIGACRPSPSVRRPSTTWCTARTSPSRSAGPCRCRAASPSSPRTGSGPAPRMFRARKKLAGYRLTADDAPRAAGQGQEISGPIGALPQLSGPGAAGLRELLTPSPAA
jgi:hypothetical protein